MRFLKLCRDSIKRVPLFILLSSTLVAAEDNSPKLKALSNSLDPLSVPQHLAFYELYPNSPEGKKALQKAWNLLAGKDLASVEPNTSIPLAQGGIQTMIALVNSQPFQDKDSLSDEELTAIEQLAQRLPNRQLKGHSATTIKELVALPPEQIDLARALLVNQYGEDEKAFREIRNYEAIVDLMALQILARTSFDAPANEKIREMNRFIFEEMHFRFPPHSLYAKNIDVYTFLPSVLDSHRGVCLGVSNLYLCLAQRLNLFLEIITPPGHIYVRHREGDFIINIETTARGINLPNEIYLGIQTRSLQQRNMKEVIGLTGFNQASVYWMHGDYPKAIAAYEKAKIFLPNDKLLAEFLGYNYLFNGDKEKGEALLREVKDYVPDYAVHKSNVAEDYLKGNADADGLKALFLEVDESRESIVKKQKTLEEVVKNYPKFRGGIFQLATTWLQLGREKEALEVLARYHELDQSDPVVEYYLSALYAGRLNYPKAWEHLVLAEEELKERDYSPKALKEFRQELSAQAPQ